MKTKLTILVVLIVVGIALLGQIGSVVEVGSNERIEFREIEKEVTPDWASDEDAVKAAQDVIRKKELQAEEARLVAEIKERQDTLDGVRKELGTF
jgi:hypothetical protein